MQNIKMYVNASESLGVIRDEYNAKSTTAPTFVRGSSIVLDITLLANSSDTTPLAIANLTNITGWRFVMAQDFDTETTLLIKADSDGISVSSTDTETIVSIAISTTNTEEIVEYLGTSESKSGIVGELVGYDGNGTTMFVLQLTGFTVRNTLNDTDELPTAVAEDYLNAEQTMAIINSKAPATEFKSMYLAETAVATSPDDWLGRTLTIYTPAEDGESVGVYEFYIVQQDADGNAVITKFIDLIAGIEFTASDLLDGVLTVNSELAPWGVLTHEAECIGLQFFRKTSDGYMLDLGDLVEDLDSNTWKVIF